MSEIYDEGRPRSARAGRIVFALIIAAIVITLVARYVGR
jgi:hypothetical protein